VSVGICARNSITRQHDSISLRVHSLRSPVRAASLGFCLALPGVMVVFEVLRHRRPPCSSSTLSPSPPAEKATAGQDQARQSSTSVGWSGTAGGADGSDMVTVVGTRVAVANHSIELVLKAYLAHHGLTEKQLQNPPPMPLYWLCYRHNNQISGPMASPGLFQMAACGAAPRDYVFDGRELLKQTQT